MIAELSDVLNRSHLAARIAAQHISVQELITQYAEFAEWASPQNVPAVIADDPDEDHVLACAIAGQANLIVSGDKHLHRLGGQYNGIAIVNAADAIRIILAGQ